MGWTELTVNLLVGLVSGAISGLLVWWITYKYTKKKDTDYYNYKYVRDYLFSALEYAEISLPVQLLESGKDMFSEYPELMDSLLKIELTLKEQYFYDDELTDSQALVAQEVLNSWKCLEKWKSRK